MDIYSNYLSLLHPKWCWENHLYELTNRQLSNILVADYTVIFGKKREKLECEAMKNVKSVDRLVESIIIRVKIILEVSKYT